MPETIFWSMTQSISAEERNSRDFLAQVITDNTVWLMGEIHETGESALIFYKRDRTFRIQQRLGGYRVSFTYQGTSPKKAIEYVRKYALSDDEGTDTVKTLRYLHATTERTGYGGIRPLVLYPDEQPRWYSGKSLYIEIIGNVGEWTRANMAMLERGMSQEQRRARLERRDRERV